MYRAKTALTSKIKTDRINLKGEMNNGSKNTKVLGRLRENKGNNGLRPRGYDSKVDERRMGNEHLRYQDEKMKGEDPLDGLENWKDTQPISYDLAKVYWEIYKEEN